MKIAVAGVEDVADAEAIVIADFLDAAEGCGSLERGMTPSRT